MIPTAAPSAENKEFPRKTPPMLHTPTPTEDRLPSISLIRRALARKYSTKGPSSQSTTINQVAYYSVANPVEYPQEKALLLPAPLNKCPPTQITSTTRQTEQVDERSKEINPLHPKSHPTNLPTLQSAYSNRPTRHAERGAKDPAADECPKLPCCCCYNVRRQSSPEHKSRPPTQHNATNK